MSKIIYVDRSCADSIWSVLTPVSKKLASLGHEVFWVKMCSGAANRVPAPEGVQTIEIEVPRDSFPCAWIWQMIHFAPKLRKLLKSIRPDIVHSNFIIPGVVVRCLGARYAKKVVSTQHEMYGSMNPLLRCVSQWSDQFVDKQIYVSQTVAQSYGEDDLEIVNHSSPNKLEKGVVYNGIDFSSIEEVKNRIHRREPFQLLCVGRLMPEKGQAVLVRALSKLKKDLPDLSLHFCGNGPDEQNLRSLVDTEGVADSVCFHGWLSYEKVCQMMCESALILQPSDGTQEGFGLSLVEAIATGNHVLVSDIPVFREVLDGINSDKVKFVPAGQVYLWEEAIRDVLRDEDDAQKTDIEAILESYSTERNAESYLRVYSL